MRGEPGRLAYVFYTVIPHACSAQINGGGLESGRSQPESAEILGIYRVCSTACLSFNQLATERATLAVNPSECMGQ